MPLAVDRNDDLVETPSVAKSSSASVDFVGEVSTKFLRQSANRFVADDDSARGQKVFDHSRAERKAEMEPNRMGDHFGRKTIAAVEGVGRLDHPRQIPENRRQLVDVTVSRAIYHQGDRPMVQSSVQSIIHPTDFSPEGANAFAHALRIAVASRSVLHLVHVDWNEREVDWEHFPHVRETLVKWGMIEPDATLEEVERALGLRVSKATLESDNPALGIADFVERNPCDLLVLMTHIRSATWRWLLGSTAEIAARQSRASTMFLREGQKGFVDRDTGAISLNVVLMPVVASVSPLAAWRRIADLAHTLQSSTKIMLLHVGAETPKFQGLLPHIELRQGQVVETILSYAKEVGADLIAMPTGGAYGVLEALRGSTSERVLHEAPCPVLAVPAA
jgi:nucleotide-binding universal stress UspA family protein